MYLILKIIERALKIIRFQKEGLPINLKGGEASDYIYERLMDDRPCMISRFGSVELDGVCRCLARRERGFLGIKGMLAFVRDERDYFFYNQQVLYALRNNAGVFDINSKTIESFTDEYLKAVREIDVLGSWMDKEKYLKSYYSSGIKRVPLGDLEPYRHKEPWSRALEGKKVLVIHPFVETIKKQYELHRKELFEDSRVLPEFDLKLIKAVQTIAGSETNFSSWIEALESMKAKIKETDFDVAIIGCGSYGMPLASYVKSLGKKAVHLGGATQILFGIKGKRWEEREDFRRLFNESWTRASDEEKPKNASKVEEGCYW